LSACFSDILLIKALFC